MGKKSKRKKRLLLALTIILLIGVVAAYFVFIYNGEPDTETKIYVPKVTTEIKDYGYTLTDNKTKLFNTYFKNLVATLEAEQIDMEAYASVLVQLFITDLYSLDNKKTSNDIGGIQFVYGPYQEDFIKFVHTSFYKYMKNNLDGKRKQQLPNVKNVTINSIVAEQFYVEETKKRHDGYKVQVSWEYDIDLGYQKASTINLMYETTDKLSVVETTDK